MRNRPLFELSGRGIFLANIMPQLVGLLFLDWDLPVCVYLYTESVQLHC
jgi:hypothetical protein